MLAQLPDRLQCGRLGNGTHLDEEHHFIGAGVDELLDVLGRTTDAMLAIDAQGDAA